VQNEGVVIRKAVLSWLATLSLLFVAVLLIGCFLRISLGIRFETNPHQSQLSVGTVLDGGRVRLDYWRDSAFARFSSISMYWDPPKIRMPDAKRLLWEFDARIDHSSGLGNALGFVEFPVWVAILPGLIIPAIWAMRRRRKKEERGFAVIAPE
jgi:hypothetical protein